MTSYMGDRLTSRARASSSTRRFETDSLVLVGLRAEALTARSCSMESSPRTVSRRGSRLMIESDLILQLLAVAPGDREAGDDVVRGRCTGAAGL
jgi:hypothetical protein